MASFSEKNGKWRAQLFVNGKRMSKTFMAESDAKAWAKHHETRLKRKVELQSLIEAGAGIPNFPHRIVEAMQAAPLARDEIIAGAIPVNVFCGVYFLVLDGRITYVGKSTDVLRRVSRHKDEGRIGFDSFSIIPCKREDLDELEATYIVALYPQRNLSLGARIARRSNSVDLLDGNQAAAVQ